MAIRWLAAIVAIQATFSPQTSHELPIDAQSPSETQPADSSAVQPSDQSQQLQTCREGILDARSRIEDRKRWADLLLSYANPQADQLVGELLSLADRPEVIRTLCTAIAERGRTAPARLPDAFVEPLIVVLGSEVGELRTAAGTALAEYTGAEVPARLAAIAAELETPMSKRLAAVDALGLVTHRREVVEQLIRLLNLDVPEITAKAVASLEPLTPQTIGPDKAAWQQWWTRQSGMGLEAWLTDQVRMHRTREKKLAAEVQACKLDADKDAVATTARLRDFQRDILRALGSEQRDAKLVEWLDDPLPAVRLAALSIVRARIADEGKRPEGEVLAALIRMLRGGSTALRRESLEIVRNLDNSTVVEAVISRLAEEKDPATRIAVLQAIGKLGSVQAVPALIAEITDASSRTESVREAAMALALIASKPDAKPHLANAVEPLRNRMRSTARDQIALRSALLSAMAAIGDPAFNDEFLSAIESEDAGLLQAAVRGLAGLDDSSRRPRFRSLTLHSDARVRLAAVEALGKLGREDADVEPLLARLNVTVEPNELVREASWRSLRDVLSKHALRDRIRAAERLREFPELEARYLIDLIGTASASDEKSSELDELRDRLASILVGLGRHAEAVPYLRIMFESAMAQSSQKATAIGIRWLEAALRSTSQEDIATIVKRVVNATEDHSEEAQVVEAVSRFLDSPGASEEIARKKRIVGDLKSVISDLKDERWSERLAEWTKRFDAPVSNGKDPS